MNDSSIRKKKKNQCTHECNPIFDWTMSNIYDWIFCDSSLKTFISYIHIYIFFFYLGFTACQGYFTHFEPSQSLGGTKTGDPREKNTWPPASRTWLVSHVTRARLEPTAVIYHYMTEIFIGRLLVLHFWEHLIFLFYVIATVFQSNNGGQWNNPHCSLTGLHFNTIKQY